MKWHYILGIIAGICVIVFVTRNFLAGNTIKALISFILLSFVAISIFFKDRLTPGWSLCLVVICLLLITLVLLFIP